ncbi:MAG TPA: hypothetical protein VGX96_02795 [Candidatus Elarobacter sp.]|jgi:hypothetical protein|nr:hypothetical protein [Candidatus Elarobacter sp.]
MVRSLETLMILLGRPGSHLVVSDMRERVRLSVDWTCGCVASGATSARLDLVSCERHDARRHAAPVLTAC